LSCIRYGQSSAFPFGAQGEVVPTDNAISLSPDAAGSNGVYFVSDEAKNLSLFQVVRLTPGSYEIGFDSYDTFNGSDQPHDATLTANIAGVELANFDLASVAPGVWNSHSGVAKISTAGDYLVSLLSTLQTRPLILIRPIPTASAAVRLGVSQGTLRGALKAIFRKTGAKRQAELVGLLTRIDI
jgi:hypothetical protein